MAPTGRPRGRPKKADNEALKETTTTTRPTATRRANEKQVATHTTITSTTRTSAASTVVDDDDDDSIFDLTAPVRKMLAAKASSRQSRSSFVSALDMESSGYSTPATSTAVTPALETKPSTSGRGRRSAVPAPQPTPSVDAITRAALLRRSNLSLNKRKRDMYDAETEDEEEDSPDAQLARALQEVEDAATAAATMHDTGFELHPRRTPRKTRNSLPKSDFVSDSEEESSISNVRLSRSIAKRPKIELGPTGSNAVKFNAQKSKLLIADSEDDSDEFLQASDSEDDFGTGQASDSDMPLASSARQRKASSAKAVGMPQQNTKLVNAQKQTLRVSATKRSSAVMLPSSVADTEAESAIDDFSESVLDSDILSLPFDSSDESDEPVATSTTLSATRTGRSRIALTRRILGENGQQRRARLERARLEEQHPELLTMWTDLENLPKVSREKIEQPSNINRELKPFQLEGVGWMRAMEETSWGGGLLGDEMGMGKTIQAVSLIMSDFPHPKPSLVLIPPVALMQWQQEIADYTNGQLKTFVFHGTNTKTKGMSVKDLKQYNVILMSYNSLESMFRKQEKGFKRKDGIYKEKSIIHQMQFHRVILDEAHNIKQRTSGSARACFALKADHKWCLSGTPLQNRIGEFFSLVRFLNIQPFSCYFCKQCPCSSVNWDMNDDNRCKDCGHGGMQHVSVFNQELLNPIQKFGNNGPGKEALRKLRLLTDRFMLRRVKRDHTGSMELPAKEIYVDRQFFGEEENDFASSIMSNSNRKFETYVAQGVLLNNYANVFGLIMQMRQVADHPDLILKKNGDGGQNILVCCICDDTAEEAIRSSCRHDFCRECAKNYLKSSDSPDCPQCHILLSIDLEQPEIEQDEQLVKKSSIINRIKMENWTSSSKIEALVHDLYQLRSKNMSSKSIIFSQFTTMLQLVEWRLRRAGITTVMLDGSMTPAQRQASINKFMTDVTVECFLVSLKAGGVALNLTEASKVFIVDPWWNPAAEWQSADRCHRIGQARPCSITRLCIEDSVESRMVLLQEKKANMINSTINADESAMESLTPEDMQFLFRGT